MHRVLSSSVYGYLGYKCMLLPWVHVIVVFDFFVSFIYYWHFATLAINFD